MTVVQFQRTRMPLRPAVSSLAIRMAALILFLPLSSVAVETREECITDREGNGWVIIGASYAKDWPIESIAGEKTINKGIGGNQSFEMEARFDSDVLELQPRAVLIWGFINDVFRSTPEEMERAKSRIKGSYRNMIEKSNGEGIYVVVATEVTLREPGGLKNWIAGVLGSLTGKESYQAGINSHVFEINSWLREYAQSSGVPILDFQHVLAGSDGWRRQEFAAPDGSHLSIAAYDELSRYTKEQVQSFCETE